jgi:GDP-4-dehydro-6-deoxy-D-mannose reductase
MPAWLVTGAQGLVGRYVASAILRAHQDARVVGIGRSKFLSGSFSHSITGPRGPIAAPLPGDVENVTGSPRVTYHQADILNCEQALPIIQETRPDVILHLASALRDDPRRQLLKINVEGTARFFETVARTPHYSPVIVLGSSGGVYGQVTPDQLPIPETACCNPVDDYTISKFSAELIARMLAQRFDLRLRIARMFNIVAPGQDERHLAGQLALDLMRIKHGRQKDLVLGPITSTRDFIDARDVARGLLILCTRDVPDGTYNVGSGSERSVQALLETFFEASGSRVPITLNPLKCSPVSRHFADISRLRTLGFNPEVSLLASARAVWNYYESVWEDSKVLA